MDKFMPLLRGELYVFGFLTVKQLKIFLPFWIAGILMSAFLSTYAGSVMEKAAVKMKSESLWLPKMIFFALLGVASPVCMYGTIPLIRTLGEKGMPQSLLAAFMISSILLNPNLLTLSFSLGADVALLRLFLAVLAGLTAGVLIKVFYKEKSFFRFGALSTGENVASVNASNCAHKSGNGIKPGFKKFIRNLIRNITITGPYFLIGIALTSLFYRFFPSYIITGLFDSKSFLGVISAAIVGVPVYVCGGGTIPMIGAWLSQGMSLGAVTAFMITGPATKLTNLGAVKTILGTGNFLLYIIFNISFAVISGLIINLF